MGVFDTLYADCPECGTMNSEQTKGGDCILKDIHASSVDSDFEAALFSGETFHCENCGTKYEVVNETRPKLVTRVYKEDEK